MSCYHPLRGFAVGTTASGKTEYKITGYDTQYVYRVGDSWREGASEYSLGKALSLPVKSLSNDVVTDSTLIPCGQCIGCRLDYAKQWASRIMLEAGYHDESIFLTLTYDDVHLPSPADDLVLRETGEVISFNVSSLVKKDLQDFLKLLRYYSGQKFRYFACGEYGSETWRPHFHLAIFGLHLNDLRIYKRNFAGDILYNSDIIDKAWKYKGYAVIGELNYNSASYIARYVVKKWKGKQASDYDLLGLTPPFVTMSRKPGIARQYFEDNYDKIYRYDKINIPTRKGGLSVKPPRYFDKLYDVIYPSDMERIKTARRFAVDCNNKLIDTSLGFDEYLFQQEDSILRRLGQVKERSTL